jgi:hypothetical protein
LDVIARPRLRFAAVVGLSAWVGAAPISAQVDPRTALLEKAGWDALTDGNAHAAGDSFRAALEADPRNARLHLGAGIAAYLDRRDGDARTELEHALALEPGLAGARTVLAQVQHRTGDVRAAIATLEAALNETPTDATAKQARTTLERWRRELELHDRMQQAIGVQFTISFEGPSEEALAAEALASLEGAYWRIGGILGIYPPTPVSVVLYTTEQFRDITRSPSWAAGAYDGSIRVPVRGALDNRRELDRVLAHEFAHAVIRTLAPRGVPAWLNEGLASALESGELTWATDAVRTASGTVSLQGLPSGFSNLSGAQAQIAYATSALAARRLLDEAGGAAVANLLRDLGEGVVFEAAFSHRIQQSFADFQSHAF